MQITDDQLSRAIRAIACDLAEQDRETLVADMLTQGGLLTINGDDLRRALASVLEAPPAPQDGPQRVAMAFPAYNHRRYGLPWLARVTSWPVAGRPTMEFGRFLGHPGCADECEIMAHQGDVVRWGQKDERAGNSTWNKWGIVKSDGTISEISESTAREMLRK